MTVNPRTANPQPIPDLPIGVENALETLRAGPAAIRGPLDRYRATVAEQSLAVSHDPDLTSEGMSNRIQQIKERAGQAAAAELTAVRAGLDAALEVARKNLERRWPEPQTGVEAMLNRQAAWARSRSLLESGFGPTNLLAETTDLETLFVLQEELPTWMRANGDRVRGRNVTEAMVNRRIAELSGEYASGALAAACQADEERMYCEPLLKHAAGEVGGLIDRSGQMTAAIAANAARQQAAAHWR